MHSRSKIRFSFNSTKVKGDNLINLKKGAYTIELLLQQIRNSTSLYYSMFNGYVIFQDNPPKQKKAPPPVVKKLPVKPPPSKEHIISSPRPEREEVNAQFSPVLVSRAAAVDSGIHINIPVAGNHPLPKSKRSRAAIEAAAAAAAAAGNDNAGLRWQYGLQWKGTLPLYGTKNYFTGPNNHSQPYNLLIPGAWVSATFNNKHELLFLVKPAEWYMSNKKLFDSTHGFQMIGFDTVGTRRSNTLVKTGGLYAGLQYNYHINDNWIVGAGIGFQSRGKALIFRQTQRLGDTAHSSPIPDSLFSLAKNDSLANRFLKPYMITARFEVAYSFGTIDIGGTVLMPLTSPFNGNSRNQSRPLNMQVFVRWRINGGREE